MAVKRKEYVADFETITDPADVRVWAACLVEIETLETVYLDNNIDGLIEYLADKNSIVYFHNIKFDAEFVLPLLFTKLGYKHTVTRINPYNRKHEIYETGVKNAINEKGRVKKEVTYKKRDNRDKTFETLITDDGVFYSLTVYFGKEGKNYKKVEFRDSYKKLPFKVSQIAKAFKLEDSKLTIDYDAPRPVGHKLTPEEEEYIVVDCRIVAAALRIQFSKGLKKMTNASDAMNGYKDIIGKSRFEKWFPILPDELDAKIRLAYKGGYVYLNPLYKCERVLAGVVFDVNSLYPSVMYDRLLPYGYPMYFEGEYVEDEKYPLYIVRIRCSFTLKEGHLPTIQLKNNRAFIETEYLTDSRGEIVEMTLTSVDLKLFLEHYKTLNLDYLWGWKFKGATGMFKEYIDYWMHIKETNTGALKTLAKLQLNSLYGRYALSTKTRNKIPYLDTDGVIRYALDIEERRDPVYTAMACFITAYAREKTIRSAQSVYDRFIYADTDSLHLTGEDIPEGLEVHPTHLGAWKHEGTFVDSKYIRAKTYMETMREYTEGDTLREYVKLLETTHDVWREDGHIRYHATKVTCAGMPDNVKAYVTYENFQSGSTFDDKLMPRRFNGGIVLMPTTFTIK